MGHRRNPSVSVGGTRVQLNNDSKLCRGSPPTMLVLMCVLASTWMVLDYWQTQARVLDSLRTMHFHSSYKSVVIWTSPDLSNRTKPQVVAKPKVYSGDAVYYVKVFRAASMPIQMILNRYGVTHNLKFAAFNAPQGSLFPNVPSPSFLYENPREIPKDYKRVDILHEHAVYDAHTVNSYMRGKYRLIGSLREPLSQFKSVVTSLNLQEQWLGLNKAQDIVEVFLSNPDKFKNKPEYDKLKNSQAQHYGYNLYNNYKNESGFLENIDEKFDIILIYERLDESLLLMKRKFGWSINDIMYLTISSGDMATSQTLSKEPQSRMETQHRSFSNADYMLFEYFSRKLQSELDQQPSEFWQQLLNYKAVKEKFRSFCLSMCGVVKDLGMLNATQAKHLMESTVFHVPGTLGEEDITLTYSDCVLLSMSPSSWQSTIKIKQFPQFFCSAKTLSLPKEDNTFYNPWTEKIEPDKQAKPRTLLSHTCNPQNHVTYGFTDQIIYLDLFKGVDDIIGQPFCKQI